MQLFDRFDSVVFDCDGVLLDSNDLKIQAMQEALELQPEFGEADIDRCIQDFRAGFGKSRYYHIERFAKSVVHNNDVVRNIETRLLAAFAAKVEEAYGRAPIIHGVLELLKKLKSKKLFVASGSEQEQLRRVLQAKKLSGYFLDIYGSPVSKQEILRTIIRENSCESAVLVGDSSADFMAAKNAGIQFIYFSPYSNESVLMEALCVQYKFPKIDCFEA